MKAWVFDVDGVLSNLQTRQVSEPTLLPTLVKILEQGDRIAFNTGRTTIWIEERVLTPLKKLLSDHSLLKHIFLASEKGGVWKEEDKERVIQEELIVPSSIKDKVRKIVAQEFSDSMFFDEPKKTMITLEKLPEVDFAVFEQRQHELSPILKRFLQEEALTDTFRVTQDPISLEIQHVKAGKDIGMQHILTWLESTGHIPEKFICFGDNPADAHMGESLMRHDLPFTFIYVGIKPLPQLPFFPVITEEKFDKGTAEALKKLF